MSHRIEPGSPAGAALGASFRRVGWLGFWVQVFIGIAPVFAVSGLVGAVRGFSLPGTRFGLLAWLSLASVVLLLFTTWWSWRYVQTGRRLAQPGARPDNAALTRMVWLGLRASGIGILLSLAVMLGEVLYLLVAFLEAPQGGAPVFQTVEGGGPSWVSAIDMLSLMTLILIVAAEIVVLLLGMRLLHRLAPQALAV